MKIQSIEKDIERLEEDVGKAERAKEKMEKLGAEGRRVQISE